MVLLAALAVFLAAADGGPPDAGPDRCPPGARRCIDTGKKRVTEQRCNAAGTGWVFVTTCVVCVDGVSCDVPPNPY